MWLEISLKWISNGTLFLIHSTLRKNNFCLTEIWLGKTKKSSKNLNFFRSFGLFCNLKTLAIDLRHLYNTITAEKSDSHTPLRGLYRKSCLVVELYHYVTKREIQSFHWSLLENQSFHWSLSILVTQEFRYRQSISSELVVLST